MYAQVIVNNDAASVDKPFTYIVPQNIEEKIKIGHRVKIPFGIRSRLIEGFVYSISKDVKDSSIHLKSIKCICDEKPCLTYDDIQLIEFLRRKYLCSFIDAIRIMIPYGILKGIKNKKKKVILVSNEKKLESINKNNDKYREIFQFIKNNDGIYNKAEITKKLEISIYYLNKMIEKDILKVEDKIVFRYNKKTYKDDNKKVLTDEQRYAVNRVINGEKDVYLLKGVTGSGKTEVYLSLASYMLSIGKGAIVLVPEISLTPQMVERFKGRFKQNVALFHSRLSEGERFDEWQRVKNGEAKLVVGARSALFLPVRNIGLIVIDEEHENTYKSEHNPKYDARETARFICKLKNAKLVLGSATPSIESFYKAKENEFELIELKKRANGSSMPSIELVDMREELKNHNNSLFSKRLYDEMKKTLNNKKQIILFLNRRGYSTFISCRKCGYVFKCPDCDVPMTYHRNGYLVCHYCGRTEKAVKICPECKSKYVKYFGAGTERVENEVKKYFNGARVLRMDVDTTRFKNSHEAIYNAFKNKEADILIGTQMISKGLDFDDVTLVGVLAADMSLNIPDYRSAFRTYQIITQVSGRAGRHNDKGLVIVQSYDPSNYSLQFAKNNDYESLYEKEIDLRKLMDNPPFSKIMCIGVSSKDENLLKDFMNTLYKSLKSIIDKNDYTMLKPVPCIITKLKENYRWQILIKGNLRDEINKKIKDTLYILSKSVYNKIRVSIDINPNNMT
ncbi:primosomal protein N' [Clostridium sp. BJN0001]|uniref:primosomal protein N' n=1 Tax=Clostridium sp. BJN0001 TaxID=2930219 RepID=UPI001FD3FD30|nr:primosomal protein N' [Clostridium sp. BJN0001]